MRWLRRWLGYDEEPLEELVGGLSDPEAEMWAEALRNEGIPALVTSANPLLGQATRTSQDFSLHVRLRHAARARRILAPLLGQRAEPSRLPRPLRRKMGKDR